MDFEKPAYLRQRPRAFRCSDKLWDQIESATGGAIYNSTFIRRAILKELKRLEENGRSTQNT